MQIEVGAHAHTCVHTSHTQYERYPKRRGRAPNTGFLLTTSLIGILSAFGDLHSLIHILLGGFLG